MESEFKEKLDKKFQNQYKDQQIELNQNKKGFKMPGSEGDEGPGPKMIDNVGKNQMMFGNPSQITEQRRDFDLMNEEEKNKYIEETKNGMEWKYYHERTTAEVEKPKKGEYVMPDDEFTLMNKLLLDVQKRMESRKETTKNFSRMKNGIERFFNIDNLDTGSVMDSLEILEKDAQSYLNAHNFPFTFNRGVSKKKAMARDILKAVKAMKRALNTQKFGMMAKRQLEKNIDASVESRREAEQQKKTEKPVNTEKTEKTEKVKQVEEQKNVVEQQEEVIEQVQEEQGEMEPVEYTEAINHLLHMRQIFSNAYRANLSDSNEMKKFGKQLVEEERKRKEFRDRLIVLKEQGKLPLELEKKYNDINNDVIELHHDYRLKFQPKYEQKRQQMKAEQEQFRNLDADPSIFATIPIPKEASEVLNGINLNIPKYFHHEHTHYKESQKRMGDLSEALREMQRVGLKLEMLTQQQYNDLKRYQGTKPLALALLTDYRRRMNPPTKFEPGNEDPEFGGENFEMKVMDPQSLDMTQANVTTTIMNENLQAETHEFTVYPNPMGMQKNVKRQGINNADLYGGTCASCSTVSIANDLFQDNGANENLVVETAKQLNTDKDFISYKTELDEKGEEKINPVTKKKIKSNIPDREHSGGVPLVEIPRLLTANNLTSHFLDEKIWNDGDKLVEAIANELKQGNTVMGGIHAQTLLYGEEAFKEAKPKETFASNHAIHICSACYEKDEEGKEVLKGFLVKNSGEDSVKNGSEQGTLKFYSVERMKLAMVGNEHQKVETFGGIVVEKPKTEVQS